MGMKKGGNITAADIWQWFDEHNIDLMLSADSKDEAFDMLMQELNELVNGYCSGLHAKVMTTTGGDIMLIITAFGNEEYFEDAEALVAEAPLVEGWEIRALKPPINREIHCAIDDVELNSEDVWFESLDTNEEPFKMGIRLYVKGYDVTPNKESLKKLMLVILQEMAGEKAFALDIGRIEGVYLPDKPEQLDLRPIIELPGYLSNYFQKLTLLN